MKVLVSGVSRLEAPSGICRFAANLAKALCDRADVTLAVGTWQERYYRESFGLDASIQVVPVDIANRALSRNRWYLSGLPELAQRVQADVIHASYPIPLSRRRSPVPLVGTVHDLYPFDAPENFGFPNYLLNQAAFRRFIANVHGLTCVSGETKKRLGEIFARRTAALAPVVVYNTVEAACAATAPPEPIPHDYLLAVAQHRQNKNLSSLIRAFDRLRNEGVVSQLVIVGSPGPETENLTRLVDGLSLSKQVQFLHGVTESELRWLYESAKALVAPSLHEGFCLPPVEAAQYGCPAVVSDLPIFREIAPPTSVFVDPSRVDSIADGVRMSIAGLRPLPNVPEPFRQERAASQYMDLYKRVISSRAPAD